jgi:excinuclease ABC subunit C
MLMKLSSVPLKPGVYTFSNAKQKILYVGKAKNLRNRLRSYFRKSSSLDSRKASMMRDVRAFNYIVTDNELEAFVLEANFIKQYKPRFNIILRDDKNYPYIKLTVNEEWPRLEVVRKLKNDGSIYFGPFIPAGAMWETIAFIRRNFQIRNCSYSLEKPIRPCIQYQMGKCLAPCAGKISRGAYRKLVDEIRLFLSGKRKDLIRGLEKDMLKLSEDMKFEEAAGIRDRIRAIEKTWESQKVAAPELGDIDVIGSYREAGEVLFNLFFVRNGIMTGSKEYIVKNIENVPERELMHTFVLQLYSGEIMPPSEIVTPVLPEESGALSRWLGQRKGKGVKLLSPKSGKKRELLELASENARLLYRSKRDVKAGELLNDIKSRLKLMNKPESIGAFDVSNISGKEAVGAFICWSDGEFKKDMYRRLRIKTVQGIDDYSMMEEIIGRIIHNSGMNLPHLFVIDGGKGHLEAAKKIIDRKFRLKEKSPEIVAVAKNPDRVYLTNSDEAVGLEDRSQSSLLLKNIRDEVHRFAIGYHRKLRGENFLRSPLENISGIGKKRRLELLRVFGSIESIRNATIDDIAKIKGFNRNIAEKLLTELGRNI